MPSVPTTTGRLQIPPWTVVLLQVVWLSTVLIGIHTGLVWRNPFHSAMAVGSLVVVVGLYLRWRPAFWASAVIFAATAGSTIARKLATLGTGIGSDEAAILFAVAMLVRIGGLVLHQTGASFCWFRFGNIRSIRLWFWVISSVAFIIWAAAIYHVVPEPDTRLPYERNR